jgi:hypothetical protein
MRRALASLFCLAVFLALAAPPALADVDNGEGIYGETNDKVVTYTGFILVAAFALVVATLAFLQGRLERRKAAKKAAAKSRASRAEWGGGW